jgi:hypothetical protein
MIPVTVETTNSTSVAGVTTLRDTMRLVVDILVSSEFEWVHTCPAAMSSR